MFAIAGTEPSQMSNLLPTCPPLPLSLSTELSTHVVNALNVVEIHIHSHHKLSLQITEAQEQSGIVQLSLPWDQHHR